MMSEWTKLSKNEKDKALEIHEKAIVIESSIVPKLRDDGFFKRAKTGGVTAINATMLMPWDDFRRAIERTACEASSAGLHTHRECVAV